MKIPSARDVTPEERIFAALAHGSVIFFVFGLIGALVIWITQRQKSTFVAFHALQSMVYQVLQTLYWILLSIVLALVVLVISLGIGFLSPQLLSSNESPIIFIFVQIAGFAWFCGGFGLYLGFGIFGTIYIISRRDFRYPIIGKWIQRYLEADEQPITEGGTTIKASREEQLVAAICHSSVLINLFGVLVSLIVWITQKERSAYLRFQALQGLIYQLVWLIFTIIISACQMLGVFSFVPSIIFGNSLQNILYSYAPHINNVFGFVIFLWLLLVWGTIMLMYALMFFFDPLYIIIGLWGAVSVLRGRNFHFPILGRLVGKRFNFITPAVKTEGIS